MAQEFSEESNKILLEAEAILSGELERYFAELLSETLGDESEES